MKKRASHITAALAAALTLATATHAATINVSGGGSALQTAIGNANPGDILLVAPGTYSPITTDNKAITIESTGGASVTLIDGGGASRCATLGSARSHTSTVLAGFTLTNGWTTGYGGGSQGGTLNNCILTGNTADYGGGSRFGTLNNCTLTGNTADRGGGSQGGTLTDCTLTGNTANYGGGSYDDTLNNCTLTGNTAGWDGGGSCWGKLNNCIVWGNSLTGSGASTNHYNSTFSYSCTAPLPSGSYDGGGNKEDDPLFVDAANGNYRLKPNSPCIDQGDHAYVTGDFDLDGNPRIWNGQVDMGAFEWTPTPIPMVYALNFGAWLNHHGLGHSPGNWGKWLTFPDPLSPHTRPTATIEMKQGVPFVSWTPDLGKLRSYTVLGKTNLTDGVWHSPTNDGTRFFKVEVKLP